MTYVACFGPELYKISNSWRWAGKYTLCGWHDVTGENSRSDWYDKAMVGLEKKVVLRELKQMTNDQAICSKCWMPLRKMILKIPCRFSLRY